MHRNRNAPGPPMKSATLPSLRVDPELRAAAENVLRDGETLSGFVEAAVRAQIEQRQMQEQFVARGLASRDLARKTGRTIPASVVIDELQAQLGQARKRKT
jgi:hypothetical protein